MNKIENMEDPDSCLSKADDQEEIFILLARDPAAQVTINKWASMRVTLGLNQHNDPQIVSALACAARMEAQRASDHAK